MTTREEFITGLRQLADFLTANPDLAVPRYPMLHISTHGTDEEDVAAVDAFAAAAGVSATYVDEERTHYQATLHFGPLEYGITGITEAAMVEHNEVDRLGREALARQRAAEADVIDAEIVEALELDVAPDDAPLMGGARR